MGDALVVQVMRRFKEDLLHEETSVMTSMTRRWLQVETTLEAELLALTEQIDTMRANGEEISEARLYRQQRFQSLLKQLREEVAKYIDFAEEEIENRERYVGQKAIDDSAEATRIVALPHIIAGVNRLPNEAVENMIGITAEGEPLRDLLERRLLRDEKGNLFPGVLSNVINSLTSGTTLGWNPRRTAEAVKESLSGGLNKALVIARSEQLRVYREASRQQYIASGVVDGFRRLCAHDTRTCIGCLSDEGAFYRLDQHLGDHPNGRCTLIPMVTGFPQPEWQRGEEWFNTLSPDEQKEIMGEGVFDLWKSGQVGFEQLGKKLNDPIWGDRIVPRSVADLSSDFEDEGPSSEERRLDQASSPLQAPERTRYVKTSTGYDIEYEGQVLGQLKKTKDAWWTVSGSNNIYWSRDEAAEATIARAGHYGFTQPDGKTGIKSTRLSDNKSEIEYEGQKAGTVWQDSKTWWHNDRSQTKYFSKKEAIADLQVRTLRSGGIVTPPPTVTPPPVTVTISLGDIEYEKFGDKGGYLPKVKGTGRVLGMVEKDDKGWWVNDVHPTQKFWSRKEATQDLINSQAKKLGQEEEDREKAELIKTRLLWRLGDAEKPSLKDMTAVLHEYDLPTLKKLFEYKVGVERIKDSKYLLDDDYEEVTVSQDLVALRSVVGVFQARQLGIEQLLEKQMPPESPGRFVPIDPKSVSRVNFLGVDVKSDPTVASGEWMRWYHQDPQDLEKHFPKVKKLIDAAVKGESIEGLDKDLFVVEKKKLTPQETLDECLSLIQPILDRRQKREELYDELRTYKYGSPERKRISDEIDELNSHAQDDDRVKKKIHEIVRSRHADENAQRIENVQYDPMNWKKGATGRRVTDAIDFLSDMIPDRGTGLVLKRSVDLYVLSCKNVGGTTRAYYSQGAIHILASESTPIIAHEMGHWVEDMCSGARQRALDFRRERTKGDPLVNINHLGEQGRPDKFVSKYMGRVYGGSRATEITSEALNYLISNPIGLLRDDPGTFRFVLDTLDRLGDE